MHLACASCGLDDGLETLNVLNALIMTVANLLPKDGETFLYPDLFSAEESDRYFQALSSQTPWKQEPIRMFGKMLMQPRLTAWYGDLDRTYRYSGITMVPHGWSTPLLEIKEKIERLAGVRFTGALLNLYRDGKDSMGWHRDDEKELGLNPVIGSVSFGETRVFQLRHYAEKDLKIPVPLANGSFLLMRGETQHRWEHAIAKSAKPLGPRINITFRVIL